LGSVRFPVQVQGSKGKEKEKIVERIEEMEKKEGEAEACYVVSVMWCSVGVGLRFEFRGWLEMSVLQRWSGSWLSTCTGRV
jgi:hypothetical protein